MKKNNKKKKIVIKVENLSKTFRIPHEKVDTLRGAFVSAFKKTSYEEFKALDNVSFEIRKGEFFGIIGRNGSGKSTLLKILADIYVPDEGKVKINGRISPFLELGIGFNPELSGRDNIYLNGSVLGLTKKQINEKFDSIVKFSELERFIDQKLKNYSSGMQVRLAFSVAIHANRDILLMDEVLAVGDDNFQSKCLEEFNKYRSLKKTVILVTHDIDLVQRYCDRAMLLRKGKIEMIGKSEDVGNKYIYQNMSDEEKRLFKEDEQRKQKDKEKRVNNKELKTDNSKSKRRKVVEITGVDFLDKKGEKKNVFRTGEPISFKINFKFDKRPRVLNFGFGIHSETNGQIFGYNTQSDKYDVDRKRDYIIIHFNSLPILQGKYFINVSCFRNVGEVCYDFRSKYKFLKIYSKGVEKKYVGLVDIKHQWM